jgi:hypothetical protein
MKCEPAGLRWLAALDAVLPLVLLSAAVVPDDSGR